MLTDLATAQSLAERLLVTAGVPAPAAAQQAELLLVAEAKGVPSHGLLRLPRLLRRLGNGTASPTNTGKHEWLSPCYLSVDGEQGLGPVVALRALEAVVPAAERHGVAVCSITNNNHLGMLGFYAGRMAERGVVCLGMTTSEALVHPWGGTEAILGTNPLALGVPAQPHPLVLDMATSQVSMGKVHDHALRGVPLEPGWALDAAGNPTVDPVAAKCGSIAPFGGAKGYGLGLGLGAMVTFLTGAAYGTAVGGTLDDTRPSNKGDLFILMSGGGHSASEYLDQVRGSRPADPGAPVAVPGDGARARYQESVAHGIEIADELWRELTALDTTQDAAQPEAVLAE
ncbi:Ldh family oxidoreductase [Kribbella capetownensis]|uniref:Ldh family oxidoreductase n=1 Tax=Kribbella capetownensis TaxID=1572659 RepID=UPI00192E297A|nr:Ldh family oxidoreductase [Kribbella capetownensis]